LKRLNVAEARKLLGRPDLAPEDRVYLTSELAAYDALVTSNPTQRYIPHAKQAIFHAARDRIKAFLGGNRSGKTTAGILDDLIQACDAEALPAYLRPSRSGTPPSSAAS
jgi:hypothetical protein